MRRAFLLIGLGNPGKRYEGTRHNFGFAWLDAFCDSLQPKPKFQDKYESKWACYNWQGRELHLLKPQTYMNLSGKALRAWRAKNQGEFDLLVILDDMDLPLGRLRLKPKGGDGGHRGLRSIIEAFGSSDFPRLRIGVGREAADKEVVDHVLEKFSPDEKILVQKVLDRAPEFTSLYLNEGIEKAMNKINSFEASSI